MRKTISKVRGYILMEVMVSGALAAIVLAGALTYMAQAQSQTVRGAKEQTASSLAQQSIERWMILPTANLNAASFPAVETVNVLEGGNFTRRHIIGSAGATVSGLVVIRHTLTVEVEFNLALGGTSIVKASTVRFQ